MTTCTITISDASTGELTMEGRIDGHEAGAELPPPTPALVVASYIFAHAQQISEAAAAWFQRELPKADVAADSEGGDVEGVPI